MINVQLQPDTEARLKSAARAEGIDVADFAGAILERAFSDSGAGLLPPKTPQDIPAWLDTLAQFSGKLPPMPGETFSREWLYQDHD